MKLTSLPGCIRTGYAIGSEKLSSGLHQAKKYLNCERLSSGVHQAKKYLNCERLSSGLHQAKKYLSCEEIDPEANYSTIIGAPQSVVLCGQAKQFAIQQKNIVHRHQQLERINKASSVLFGAIGACYTMASNSFFTGLFTTAVWTLPAVYGMHKAASWMLERHFNPQANALFDKIESLVSTKEN